MGEIHDKGEMSQKNLVLFFNLLPLDYKQPMDRWAVMTLYPGLFSSTVYLPLAHWLQLEIVVDLKKKYTPSNPQFWVSAQDKVTTYKFFFVQVKRIMFLLTCILAQGKEVVRHESRQRLWESFCKSASSTKWWQTGGWFLGSSGWVCLD